MAYLNSARFANGSQASDNKRHSQDQIGAANNGQSRPGTAVSDKSEVTNHVKDKKRTSLLGQWGRRPIRESTPSASPMKGGNERGPLAKR